MDRFVGVIGVGRCGSSMVAGMLHHAGVQMGLPDHLIGPNHNNAMGHFEDECWHYLNRAILYMTDPNRDILAYETTNIYPHVTDVTDEDLWTIYAEQIERHRAPLWGMKGIILGLIWEYIDPMIDAHKRLVMVHRKWSGIIESRMRHMRTDRQSAERVTGYMYQRIHEQILKADVPVLHLQYEQVLADPKGEAVRLLQFVAGDMWTELNVPAATQFPNRRLHHYA